MQISLAENQQFYIGEDPGFLGKTPEKRGALGLWLITTDGSIGDSGHILAARLNGVTR